MHSQKIQILVDSVFEEFKAFEYYGSTENEKHGVCFKVPEINATFSVSTLDGNLEDRYSVQVEGIPPGDYIHVAEVGHQEFIQLVRQFREPESKWP